MGTSRRRTPPAPVSAGPPKGARTAHRGRLEIRKSRSNFKWAVTFIFKDTGERESVDLVLLSDHPDSREGWSTPGPGTRGHSYRVSGFRSAACGADADGRQAGPGAGVRRD